MPLITIRLARRETPVTREQKALLISGVTQLMHDILAKHPEDVVVLIDEIDPDNWGQGGHSASVLRQRRRGGTD